MHLKRNCSLFENHFWDDELISFRSSLKASLLCRGARFTIVKNGMFSRRRFRKINFRPCRERVSESHLLGRGAPGLFGLSHSVRVSQRRANVCCFLPTRLIVSGMWRFSVRKNDKFSVKKLNANDKSMINSESSRRSRKK